jgi:hypothetical protein
VPDSEILRALEFGIVNRGGHYPAVAPPDKEHLLLRHTVPPGRWAKLLKLMRQLAKNPDNAQNPLCGSKREMVCFRQRFRQRLLGCPIFCMIIGLTKRKAPPGGLPNRAEPALALISSKTTMIVSFSPCDVISKPRDGSRRLLTIRYSESAAGASTDLIAPLGSA